MNIELSVILPVIIAFLTSIITTLIVQKNAYKRLKKEISEGYRKDYFGKQLLAYQKLWAEYRPLSKWYDDNTIITSNDEGESILSEENAMRFCKAITDFFFSEDGVFVSKDTRRKIFILRSFLTKVIGQLNSNQSVNQDEIRKKINSMVDDLIRSTRNDLGLMNLKMNVHKNLEIN